MRATTAKGPQQSNLPNNQQHNRAINRMNVRETRSGRAALSVTVAAVLLVVTLWLGVELVLAATGQPPLLIAPAKLAQGSLSLTADAAPGALIGAAALLALLGLTLLLAAVLPGSKPRHIVDNQRSAVVVDSEVLAAAVSRAARTAARLAPEQVTSRIGKKRVLVVLHPGSGKAVDLALVREAVEGEVASYSLRKTLALHVTTGTQTVAS